MRPAAALFACALLVLSALPAVAAPSMAFGYLYNSKGDPNNNYLETIFPNAFANSIKNIFEVNVIKPAQIEKLLQRHNQRLEKQYRPQDLPGVTADIGADYFIFGSFVPLPNDQIAITLNLYSRGLNKVFTFTNTGAMETEIFKLVDRITQIMIHFLGSDNYYRGRVVPPGARIGIISNVTGAKLNYLYASLMAKKYTVAAIQGNLLKNPLTGDSIAPFKNITARENSYDLVTDARSFRVLYGTWSGERYKRYTTYMLRMFRIYEVEYLNNKYAALDRLAKSSNIDYLLIVGFEGINGNRAWVRCIDIRGRNLVWLQKNIAGSFNDICRAVTDGISAPIELKKNVRKDEKQTGQKAELGARP